MSDDAQQPTAGESAVPERVSQTAAPAAESGPPVSKGATYAAFLVFGLAAAAAGVWIVQEYRDHFRIPDRLSGLDPTSMTEEQSKELAVETLKADFRNHALTFALFGVVVGGLFGAAPGLSQRAIGRLTVGLVGGVVFGALLGGAGGLAAVKLNDTITQSLFPLLPSSQRELAPFYRIMMDHAAVWVILGISVAGAVALGSARARFGQTLTSVAGVGIIWALAYPFLAAIAFQLSDSGRILPKDTDVLVLWLVGYCVLTGLAAARSTLAPPAAASDKKPAA